MGERSSVSTPYPTQPILLGRTDGVVRRRLLAYCIDFVVISVLIALFAVVIAVAGVLTFGLGWTLYSVLVPGTAILYSALTVGGAGMGTFGMRVTGLAAVDAATGGPTGFLVAGVHALLFYVGVVTLLLLVLDIGIGLARTDRRLGHDLLAGIAVVRR